MARILGLFMIVLGLAVLLAALHAQDVYLKFGEHPKSQDSYIENPLYVCMYCGGALAIVGIIGVLTRPRAASESCTTP